MLRWAESQRVSWKGREEEEEEPTSLLRRGGGRGHWPKKVGGVRLLFPSDCPNIGISKLAGNCYLRYKKGRHVCSST